MSFKGQSTYRFISIPKITGFDKFTTCWWQKSLTEKPWTSVFTLNNTQHSKAAAFLFSPNGHHQVYINDQMRFVKCTNFIIHCTLKLRSILF